jgi:hypothetical protein
MRTECLANRDLADASAGPGQQQIGNVDAADEENQAHRAEEQNERLANAADDHFAERNHAYRPLGLRRIVFRILLLQRFNQRIEVRLCGGDGETGLEPCEDHSMQTQSAPRRRVRQTGIAIAEPQFRILLVAGRALIAKSARHDAHDAIPVVVEAQGPADDVPVGSELPSPEPVADDDLEVEAGSGVVRVEGAAQLRVCAEGGEVIRRDSLEVEAQRPRAAGEGHVGAGAGDRHGLEDAGTLHVSPLRDGHADRLRADAGQIVFEAHQFAGVWVRQWAQQRRIDHTEDGSGGADAERNGGDRNERETGGAHQHAHCVAQIEEQVFEQGQALLGVVTLADRLGCAKLDSGPAARFGGGHAGAQVLLGLEGDMFGDLFLETLVGAPPSYEIASAHEETPQAFHARSPALTSKKRAMMAAVCSHSRVSASSCLRPAAVRR